MAGFSNQILAEELVWNQAGFWNMVLRNQETGLPIDLTGATIDAQIIRRQLSNIHDSRYGLTFDIADYISDPAPEPISLTIENRDDANGIFTLVFNDDTWGLIDSDPQLNINADDCVGFSGRIKISFPAVGSTPANDQIIFLLFLIRSDGVIS